MYALVDCNSFYASCEQIFRPDLRGKPVVVLSNNDGFIVARSPEAKQLGIPDLEPFFKTAHILKQHKVAIFSSNYPLYGDISHRVTETLMAFSPHLEVYSIDETFMGVTGTNAELKALGKHIKQTLWRNIRMPVGVGIAPTKTLAKLANRIAKDVRKCAGVCVLDEPYKWQWVQKRLPVSKVWGIGRRLEQRLNNLDIHSIYDLAQADPTWVRQHTSINVARIIAELNGTPCLELEETPSAKQEIISSRSFGNRTTALAPILEAVALYASRAAEKLRAQQSLANSLHVFIETPRAQAPYFAPRTVQPLPYPTDDTRLIVAHAKKMATQLYRANTTYIKAGVGLRELIDRQHQQFDMWQPKQSHRAQKLMDLMDSVNKQQGKDTLFLAAQGISKPWYMRQQYKSPEYTTRWSELPVANKQL